MLKLLANQQKDGDSPIQSIVTGLHERSRKGIMEGLRSFINAEDHRAVNVGHLHKGVGPFCVRKPKFSEDYPEAAIREGADEFTLRSGVVGALKACINIDHVEYDRWGPPVDADWHAFCQAIEGKEWEEGARKPSECRRAKALWAIKAAKDREEKYYDPARKDNILGRKKDTTGAVRGAPPRPNHNLGQSVEVIGESLSGLAFGSKSLVESRVNCNGLLLCGHQDFAKDVRKAVVGKRPTLRGPVGQCAPTYWNVPGKYTTNGELFFFLIKEPVASNDVPFNLCVSEETLKACALICLHLLAAEGEAGSSGRQSPARNGSALARQARPPLVVRSMSTTTSAGPLMALGRIG